MQGTISKTEAIPNARRTDPSIQDLPKYMIGPFIKGRLRTVAIIYMIAAVIGIIPTITSRFGIWVFPESIQCAG